MIIDCIGQLILLQALIDDQSVVWGAGFGYADQSAKREATPHTLYRAGSVSKLFTAIAVMQLVEDVKLNLDAPLQNAVPEFDLHSRFGSIDAITLRNTLSHHAGIPSNIIDGMWVEHPASYKTVATRLHDYYAAYPPNTVFAYSNAGYSLAGHAIENASGMPFVNYLQEQVLMPLGMGASNFALDTNQPFMARSYRAGKAFEEPRLRDLPAGGLVSNVLDLSELVTLIHRAEAGENPVLSNQSLLAMMTPQRYESPYDAENLNGLGFFVFPDQLNGKPAGNSRIAPTRCPGYV